MTQPFACITAITFESIDLTDGFWYEKQKLVRDVSVHHVYKRFAETGRFEAFRHTWKEGMPNPPHVYWDSDVAKWIEAVAYLCEKQRDPALEAIVDETVTYIEKNRMDDGYYNSYFGHFEPQNRFTRRDDHELYCFGHLTEAAIAYKRATGKDKLLSLMTDYADLLYRVFYVEKSAAFTTPGHEEAELALIKLYRETKEKRYLDLALYFIEERGAGAVSGTTYAQDHLPTRKQCTAEGHAVRACYFYAAIADAARETGDASLFRVAKTLFENIVRRKMYVTGAIGQTVVGESFSGEYDLPNESAYAETCANLSLALFARRMSVLDPDSVYADTAERVLYNSFLSGMSLDGKSFFYSNMQEHNSVTPRRAYDESHRIFTPAPTRVEVFDCSCCPPNVVRTIASVADFLYTADETTVFMHQYMSHRASIGQKSITVETQYPYDGCVRISYLGGSGKLALRIPGWCREYTVTHNGRTVTPDIQKGYAYLSVSGGDEIVLNLEMPVRFIEAHPRVWQDAGRIAVSRGPLVYCLEGVDQPTLCLRDIRLSQSAEYHPMMDETLGVIVLESDAYVRLWENDVLYDDTAALMPCRVRLIPYFAIANRGETDMIIWTLKL